MPQIETLSEGPKGAPLIMELFRIDVKATSNTSASCLPFLDYLCDIATLDFDLCMR